MKIALIGATGTIGGRILQEALTRDHQVTVVTRDTSRFTKQNENLQVVEGDIFNSDSIQKAVAGHDVVISAYGPTFENVQALVEATHSLINGVKQSRVPRLVAVGGAGSLEVAPGVHVVDTPDFPDFVRPLAIAHRDALEIYRQESDLNWTSFSPAGTIEPGERTGKYRTGTDQLVIDEKGESRITAEDYAIAMLDEVENPRFSRQRFTVAY